MYNLVFGRNPASPYILAALGLTPADFGRFRDAFVANSEIAVYTRCGGNNRQCSGEGENTDSEKCPCYGCAITYRLPKHPYYLRDVDDNFDNTYATVYFKFPPEFADDLKRIDSGETFDPDKKWHDAIEALNRISR